MELNETIKYCEDIAEHNEKLMHSEKVELSKKYTCEKNASFYHKLADWLRELEWRRMAMNDIREAMLMPSCIAEAIQEEKGITYEE